MHFMNPVPVMKLVELIRGMQTSDEVMPNPHDRAIRSMPLPRVYPCDVCKCAVCPCEYKLASHVQRA